MRVALLDDYQAVALEVADWSRLHGRCEIVAFGRPLGVDEASGALQNFDILCTLRERMVIPRNLIESLPNLKFIVVTGKRYDAIDVAAAAERGVPVSNTNVRGGGGVAELVWGLILSCARHIPLEARRMREGGWQNSIGITLRGKTLGVLGLGSVGRQVAAIGQAFGMDVVAWSQNLTGDAAQRAGARLVSKDELFRMSDVLTVHVVLSDRTRGLVGQAELAQMKSTAILVNTARGPIVDEAALIDALFHRRIAMAGLDVFDAEPLPDAHPLRKFDNVVLTPHLGYYTREMVGAYYEDAITTIEAWLDGSPINVINASLAR